MESELKSRIKFPPMDNPLSLFISSSSSSLLSSLRSSKSAPCCGSSPVALLLRLLRRSLLVSLRLLLTLLSPLLLLFYPRAQQAPSAVSSPSSSAGPATAAERALLHVLSVVSRVPVASRKYEIVRSLAERLLDENLRFSSCSLNVAALSSAFSQTVCGLELVVPPPAESWPIEMVISAVRSGVRRWEGGEAATAGGEGKGPTRAEAEKMAAEAVWLATKMAECGAVEEAVRRWGEAAGLAKAALTVEPRIQVAFVRVSAFLFKHANAKQFGRKVQGEGEDEEDRESLISRYRMAMLTSWLPLLCRASNGTDAPILSSGERAEMVKVLEEMIEKLSCDQQEEVLALWLHHFTTCPDSDWPNLEACYTRWYSQTRGLLLK